LSILFANVEKVSDNCTIIKNDTMKNATTPAVIKTKNANGTIKFSINGFVKIANSKKDYDFAVVVYDAIDNHFYIASFSDNRGNAEINMNLHMNRDCMKSFTGHAKIVEITSK